MGYFVPRFNSRPHLCWSAGSPRPEGVYGAAGPRPTAVGTARVEGIHFVIWSAGMAERRNPSYSLGAKGRKATADAGVFVGLIAFACDIFF